MFQYLALTDGTTVLDLSDTISYALVSYAPVIAPLRDNELGSGVYADVTEQITIQAIGCSAAEAYQAAAAVDTLLTQARRWWKGENVSAVRLLIQAQNSSFDPLQVIIKGRAPGSPPNMALPATWNAQAQRYVVQGITIQFVRRGQLLNTAESASGGAVSTGDVSTATFGSTLATLSPISVALSNLASLPGLVLNAGFLIVAKDANQIGTLAAVGAVTGPFTSVNNNGAPFFAWGSNVLRYTPTGTTPASAAVLNLPAAVQYRHRRLAVYATVRNNSTTTNFIVTLTFALGALFGNTLVSTIPTVIGSTALNPKPVFLGIVSAPRADVATLTGLSSVQITVQASAASGSFDIDELVFVSLDDEANAVISLSDSLETPAAGPTTVTLNVSSNALSLPAADVTFQRTSGGVTSVDNLSYLGDPAFQSIGNQASLLWLATRGIVWRIATTAPALFSFTPTFSRFPAYLVPQ